ncbi:hypothetical protein AHiyo8_55240 [Arthrobacter sp. Hiyo8]|nr:hypothetical protein AHiyo8_55240 [Arthrobacter sp. Hiyo8]
MHQQGQRCRTPIAVTGVPRLLTGPVHQHSSRDERRRTNGEAAEGQSIDREFSGSELSRDCGLDDGAGCAVSRGHGQFDGLTLP